MSLVVIVFKTSLWPPPQQLCMKQRVQTLIYSWSAITINYTDRKNASLLLERWPSQNAVLLRGLTTTMGMMDKDLHMTRNIHFYWAQGLCEVGWRTALPGLLQLPAHPGYSTSNHTEQSHRVAVAGQCFIKPNQSRAWCPVLLLGFSHWFPRMSFWATRSYFGFQTPKSLCTKNRAGTGTCFWGMFLRHSLRQGIDIVASGRDGSEEIPSHCQVQPRFCR